MLIELHRDSVKVLCVVTPLCMELGISDPSRILQTIFEIVAKMPNLLGLFSP